MGLRGEIEQRNSNQNEQEPYALAARFDRQSTALRTYNRVQELIFRAKEQCDLSAYRFLLDRVSYVAVLGEMPAPEIDQQLRALLASGELSTLAPSVLAQLYWRRARAISQGSWVEGHYRPGRHP